MQLGMENRLLKLDLILSSLSPLMRLCAQLAYLLTAVHRANCEKFYKKLLAAGYLRHSSFFFFSSTWREKE